jgi:DNA polymerase-3 subunit delta
MNNYLILSNDKIVIDTNIKDIVKKIKDDDKEIIKMDLTVNSLSEVLEVLNTYTFLSNIKVVILYNSLFIEGDSTYDKELKQLEKYLNEETDNYFIMVAGKMCSKKNIVELLKNVKVIEENINSEQLVKDNLEIFKMDNGTIKYFVNICHNNYEKIINELNKLKLYKIDDPTKLITRNDIDLITIREYDDNIFDLVNAITNRNKKQAIELYNRLREKEDSTLIIGAIASKIRMLYSIKVLRDDRFSVDAMAELLDVKRAAVSISLESCDNFSSERLLNLLDRLFEIDIKSKSETKDLDLQFKLFLMNI